MINTNSFAPVGGSVGPLTMTVLPGIVYLNGTQTTIGITNVACAANTTTNIYLDLQAATIASTLLSFPNGSVPIATVVTNGTVITSLTDVRPDIFISGPPLVGFATLSGIATAVTPILPNTFNQLVGWARVTFYGSSDTLSFRFGNTASAVDSGNNYNYRWATQAAGGTTFANRDSTADSNNSLIKMAAQDTTLSREINFSISNTSNKVKQVQMQSATETAGISTLPSLDIGQGQWFNTTGQIGCFQILTAGGATFGGSIAFYGSK